MRITLAILAAGLGSRFGSDKQLQHIYNDNILLDYSIYDAIAAGFDNIVLIIRQDIDQLVQTHFKNKFKGIDISFVYQDLNNPKGINREKPWGTAHAMLCLKEVVKNPFLIINADDFYGKQAFAHMAKALRAHKKDTFFSAGYILGNTLSENGTVSRGVCEVDENMHLQSITEMTKLQQTSENEATNQENGQKISLSSYVSMNFWGFSQEIFSISEPMFEKFVQENKENPKSEFFIPLVVQQAKNMGYKIEVLPNESTWFGMTYKEDLAIVQNEIQKLISMGEYPTNM